MSVRNILLLQDNSADLFFTCAEPSMRTSLVVIAGLLLVTEISTVQADQPLVDYRRIVIANKPNLVQKVAADELARYVGRILDRKLEILPVSRYSADAPGLSFFVGDEVATKILKLDLGAWKDEE